MTPGALLSSLATRGVTLARDGDRLTVSGASALTDDDRAAIRLCKPRLLEMLSYTDAQLAALDELAARLPDPAGQEVREAWLLDDGRGWVLAIPLEEYEALAGELNLLKEARDRREACPRCGGSDRVARDGTGPHHGRIVCAGCAWHFRWLNGVEAEQHGVRRREAGPDLFDGGGDDGRATGPGGVGGVDQGRARRPVARGGDGPGLFGVLDAAAGREGQGAGVREGGSGAGADPEGVRR